ncbi:unnamed protein product [Merluccius merluccius]
MKGSATLGAPKRAVAVRQGLGFPEALAARGQHNNRLGIKGEGGEGRLFFIQSSAGQTSAEGDTQTNEIRAGRTHTAAMWVCLSLLAAVCLLPGRADGQGGGLRCQAPPDWKVGGVAPMKEAAGRVTVVALLQAS